MGFTTTAFTYKHGVNMATMVNKSLIGTDIYTKGSKVKDKGLYEIEFSYSVRKADTTGTGNPHFYIGFGTLVTTTSGSMSDDTLIRLGADNTASQSYPNQRSVKVWLEKTDDTELDFMCRLNNTTSWYMYNINASARKIADT